MTGRQVADQLFWLTIFSSVSTRMGPKNPLLLEAAGFHELPCVIDADRVSDIISPEVSVTCITGRLATCHHQED